MIEAKGNEDVKAEQEIERFLKTYSGHYNIDFINVDLLNSQEKETIFESIVSKL